MTMPTINILYIHGFMSSKNSHKAIALSESLNGHTAADLEVLFEVITYPQRTVATSLQALEKWIQIPVDQCQVVLMGSSLGGYYAQYFGQKYQLPYCMINPALNVSLFDNHQGIHQNPTSGEAVVVDAKYIHDLKKLQPKTFNHQLPVLLLMDEDDAVIDVKFAQKLYRPVNYPTQFTTKVYKGGSHDFEHLHEALPEMVQWLEACVKITLDK